MKHIAKRLLSLLLVVCLVLSVAVIPAGAAETKLTSVYASYAAEGHTNAPIEDDVFEAKSDSITVSIMTTTDMHGRAYDWNSYTNSALSNNFLQAAKLRQQSSSQSAVPPWTTAFLSMLATFCREAR